MKLQWNFVGLLGARGAKLTLGLATMFIYARIFGVSATYDAWVWSLGVINALSLLLFGPITETIRASYSSIDHRDGHAAAERYIATIAVMMVGSAVLVAALSCPIVPTVAQWLTPRQSEQANAASFFLYALAPSLALSQVVAVLTAYLNCHGKVYAPEFAGIAGGTIGLMFIIAFPQLLAPWLLLGSYYIALVAPLVVGIRFWPRLISAISRLRWGTFRTHAREALAFSSPLLLPYALGQVSGIIERQYALLAGTGALSILSYAFFARNTVQSVFTAALSALAVPALARVWDTLDTLPFRNALAHWVRQCLMLVTVGMIAMFGLSDIIPLVLFGSKISGEHQALLASLLRLYAVAIIAVILYLVGGSALLAARKGKAYASFGALASLAAIVLLVALFPLLKVAAIPVALGISHLLAAGLMFHTIHRADAPRVIKWGLVRMLVVLAAGSALLAFDHALADRFGLAPRLTLGVSAAFTIAMLWWFVEHRLSRDTAHALSQP